MKKILVAVSVISLATTCLATCMPCRNYQLSLLQGTEGLQKQVFIKWGKSVFFHCTFNFDIIQGIILINGSTPDLENIKRSNHSSTITLTIFNITYALDGAVLWCEANFSTSCQVCTSNNISLHIIEAPTEPPGTPHLPATDPVATTEAPPRTNQSTSEEIVGDDETTFKVNVTENTLTDASTAVGTSYKIVLPTVIITVFVILVLIITLILCYKIRKRRSRKGKTQRYDLSQYDGPDNLNGDTNSTEKDNEVAMALNKVESKLEDLDDPPRDIMDPLLQPPEDTLSDTGTAKIKDTASDTGTEQHGTKAKELCRAGSAVNGEDPVLKDKTASQDEDADNLHVPMETNQKSGSKTVYTTASRTQDFVQYEYLQGSIVRPQDKELTSNEDALAVPQAQMSGPTKSDLPNSRRVIPRTPRGSAADRSGTDQSTQIPHGSSGTSSPEDSGSSGVAKSDRNGSASSNGMGPIAEMELPIIDTSTSIAEQIITSDQNVCNSFSSTTGN